MIRSRQEVDGDGQRPPEEVQRWTAKRGVGETSVPQAGRTQGVTMAEIGDWQERCLLARPKDEEALKDRHSKKLKQKIGDRALDLNILKEVAKHRPVPGGALGEVKAADPRVSERRLCRVVRLNRAASRDYRLRQEFITPYTPEQHGMIERFFGSLKEACVWQHLFPSFAAARREIAAWIRWYNEARPHQALGYRSPREHRAQQGQLVA